MLWDTFHRQAVEPLATCMSFWGQTTKMRRFYCGFCICYITSVKSWKKMDGKYKANGNVMTKTCCLTLHYHTRYFINIIGKSSIWFIQSSSHFSIFFFPITWVQAHTLVNMVEGDPRCCNEEEICHSLGVLLLGLQEKRLCQTLKMCHLGLLVCGHLVMTFSFWHTGRSRKAPTITNTADLSKNTCPLF